MMRFRKATEDDSHTLFIWRNDPVTRLMSITTDEVSWDKHSSWFAATLVDSSVVTVICEDEQNTDVAVVRFALGSETVLVSINLAPDRRGEGLAPLCLRGAIEFYSTLKPDQRRLRADVKVENLPSRRLFEGLGFELLSQSNEIITYELVS